MTSRSWQLGDSRHGNRQLASDIKTTCVPLGTKYKLDHTIFQETQNRVLLIKNIPRRSHNTNMASEGNQQPSSGIKKKLSYSLPSPGLFDLERGPDPGNLSPSFTRGSDDVPGSGASEKPLTADDSSHGHGIGRQLSSVLHRTFTQQFRAADSGGKDSGFRNLFQRGRHAGKHWRNRKFS